MRAALFAFLLLTFAGAPALAQNEDAFPWRFRQWFPLRDMSPAEYEPDFAWQRLSETQRQNKSGIDFWYGSLSERRLGVDRRLQLNLPLLGEAIRFRWQYEEVTLEDIQTGSEKIELQFRVAGPVAITLSGNGVLEKQDAAAGAGVLVTSADRTSYLDLALRHDAPVHDARTPYDAEYRRPPLRLLGETNVIRGPVRLYGFADWGLESRRVFETQRGSGGVRDAQRYTRRTELKLEYALTPDLDVGVRHRYTGQGDDRRHFDGYIHPEKELVDYDFDRAHHKVDVFGESRFAPVRVRAIAGYWIQDDTGNFAIGPDWSYRRTQFLFGTRAHYALSPELELGVGYWGNVMTAVREPRGSQPVLRHRRERHEGYYVDKADFVVTYRFNETARLEFLISQEVTRGEFGGGSGKAILLF
jgi:hypothetical protein